jgi:hypothetical protein
MAKETQHFNPPPNIMTIYEIKEKTQQTAPYFFSRDTLKFFGQTMSSFRVKKQSDGRIMIFAPMRDRQGKKVGETIRYFNPITNELERE